MTVKDLIYELESYNGDAEVVFKASNSTYADSIGRITETELRSFWGSNKDVVVVCGDDQVGAV